MKKSQIQQVEYIINGEKVKVTKINSKSTKRGINVRTTFISCPNCLSHLRLNDKKQFECTGDKIQTWVPEFEHYSSLPDREKEKYIDRMSNSSRFQELYDYWMYSVVTNQPEEFTCGYSNDREFPIPIIKQEIPDPVFCKETEKSLGRKLTEEELEGEDPLYFYKGSVQTNYKPFAKKHKIIWVSLPSEKEIERKDNKHEK